MGADSFHQLTCYFLHFGDQSTPIPKSKLGAWGADSFHQQNWPLLVLWDRSTPIPQLNAWRHGRRQASSTKIMAFRSLGSVHTDAKVEVGRPGVVISPPWTRTGSRRIQNYTDQPDLLPTQPTQRWVYGLNNPYQNTPPPPPRCLTNSKLAKHGSEVPGGGGWARTNAFAK